MSGHFYTTDEEAHYRLTESLVTKGSCHRRRFQRSDLDSVDTGQKTGDHLGASARNRKTAEQQNVSCVRIEESVRPEGIFL